MMGLRPLSNALHNADTTASRLVEQALARAYRNRFLFRSIPDW